MKDSSKLTTKCLLVVKDYNYFMWGVNLADRYRSLNNVDRKSSKWWMRIFWRLLDITFVNAFVIYCETFGEIYVLEVRRYCTWSYDLSKIATLKIKNRRGKKYKSNF